MQNNNNMCFKWAVMRALNPIDKNKHQIRKELRKQAEEYDWSEIPFTTPYADKSVDRFQRRYGLSINVYGYVWKYSSDLDDMELLIIPLRLSMMEGKEFKEVNLFL